ncbi:HAMP domain-containing sensor histidine kinase [Persicobacter diffluens]|uniref:histidine kinase n=1 Tax=Persicobacter diffluens TaxID=981 RepID=A0AAN5AK86_9BACT|nr:two-component sensor histidine kinase [Persicobacter diffluens]
MQNKPTLSNRLIVKLSITFFMIILLIGAAFLKISTHYSAQYFSESLQKLNANLANHLIEEKFTNERPFLEDGSVNKPLFGDLMHDMMAVNRAIEVYLLNEHGEILYSVVLDHSDPNNPMEQVNLSPVKEYLATGGQQYILGDNPRDRSEPTIFSVAPFEYEGRKGYIYIVLAGQTLEAIQASLSSSYFFKGGLTAMTYVLIFALITGLLFIWFLTRNLREIIFQVNRFQEGDLKARVPQAEKNDLFALALAFNKMADKIVSDMEKIKSVDVMRRELIANVSHDLRTPLAILRGYTETLQMKSDSLKEADKNKYLDIIHNSSEKLSNMVAQLFEYSKLEAKQVEAHKEAFLITELAHDLQAKNKVLADQKNIELKLEMEGKIPLVFADIKLVERAIQNLIDNALKFTPENGEVVIGLDASPEFVQVMIKDSGKGIPEEDQSYIFERYRQSDQQKAKLGAGLGLAIVKKILEIHESTIKVESEPDQGTAFFFALPAYKV